MKKKIKDLSGKEANKICNKQWNCRNCPLNLDINLCFKDLIIKKEKIEQEIEVEEDE